MSKLIVDMPMPKGCYFCPMSATYPTDWYCMAYDNTKSIEGCAPMNKRPVWCPIKGALPDEHGRLIDASTVIGIQEDEEDNDFPVTVDDYLGLQFPVPTIVPATERSEHGTTAD